MRLHSMRLERVPVSRKARGARAGKAKSAGRREEPELAKPSPRERTTEEPELGKPRPRERTTEEPVRTGGRPHAKHPYAE